MECTVGEDRGKLAPWADYYELLSIALSFPEEPLAAALLDGSFAVDCGAVLEELGVRDGRAHAIELQRQAGLLLGGEDVSDCLAHLRKEHSLLYLAPGKTVRVYPFESAFLHAASGDAKMPVLFITKCTVDVENYMKRADELPDDFATEPVDRIDKEAALMSNMLVKAIASYAEEREEDGDAWLDLACSFKEKHLDSWLEAFFAKTEEEDPDGIFGAFARCFATAL